MNGWLQCRVAQEAADCYAAASPLPPPPVESKYFLWRMNIRIIERHTDKIFTQVNNLLIFSQKLYETQKIPSTLLLEKIYI